MTERITLRSLRVIAKRAPRMLGEYLAKLAEDRLNQPLDAPADEHGYAMDVDDASTVPTRPDAKPWRRAVIPKTDPPKDPHR